MGVNGVQVFSIMAGGDDDLLCAWNETGIVSILAWLLTLSQKRYNAGLVDLPVAFFAYFSVQMLHDVLVLAL